MKYKDIQIDWLGQDTFVLTGEGKTIVVDPVNVQQSVKADIVLVTHDHYDHFSIPDIMKVSGERIIVAKECEEKIPFPTIPLSIGDEAVGDGIKIKAFPAYTKGKINPYTKKEYHPKEDEKIGFLITFPSGTTIYHMGDTDDIPEIQDIKANVVLVPICGNVVMSAKEAATYINKIKPDIAIPMHYGTISGIGTEEDAKEFQSLVKGSKVEILENLGIVATA